MVKYCVANECHVDKNACANAALEVILRPQILLRRGDRFGSATAS